MTGSGEGNSELLKATISCYINAYTIGCVTFSIDFINRIIRDLNVFRTVTDNFCSPPTNVTIGMKIFILDLLTINCWILKLHQTTNLYKQTITHTKEHSTTAKRLPVNTTAAITYVGRVDGFADIKKIL